MIKLMNEKIYKYIELVRDFDNFGTSLYMKIYMNVRVVKLMILLNYLLILEHIVALMQ